jgi:hypothetical protein
MAVCMTSTTIEMIPINPMITNTGDMSPMIVFRLVRIFGFRAPPQLLHQLIGQ